MNSHYNEIEQKRFIYLFIYLLSRSYVERFLSEL